jgi:hypothetical protein
MTKRVVLIGHPVAHSLSAAMQQAGFDKLGLDAQYELWDRTPAELAAAVAELRTEEFLGANVTIPHKERVVPMIDRLTGAVTETLDDHRLAMTFAVAGLVARGETLVRDPGSADVSYPGFFGELERVRA